MTHHRTRLPGCTPFVWYGATIGRIKPYLTGEFEFQADGLLAYVIVIRNENGEATDAVAWAIDDANCWWVRFGPVPVLAHQNAALAAAGDAPLFVHSTPERWVRSRGRGVVVLDWAADLFPVLGHVQRLITDAPALADKLNQSLLRKTAVAVSPVLAAESIDYAA